MGSNVPSGVASVGTYRTPAMASNRTKTHTFIATTATNNKEINEIRTI